MNREEKTSELLELAALGAAGSLDRSELLELERRSAGATPAERAEVRELDILAAEVAVSAAPLAPRPGLRERVLARAKEPPAFHFLLAPEGRWDTIAPGIHRKILFRPRKGEAARSPGAMAFDGSEAYLMRMDPGAASTPHSHSRVEHCYVIEGDLRIAGAHIGAGDYHVADAGSIHEPITSDTGCVFLIVNSPPASPADA